MASIDTKTEYMSPREFGAAYRRHARETVADILLMGSGPSHGPSPLLPKDWGLNIEIAARAAASISGLGPWSPDFGDAVVADEALGLGSPVDPGALGEHLLSLIPFERLVEDCNDSRFEATLRKIDAVHAAGFPPAPGSCDGVRE